MRYFNVEQHKEPKNMFSKERKVDISALEKTAKEITEKEDIQIGELGEERTFVSGTKHWRIEWAEIFGERFEVGHKVSFFDEDDNETFIGIIDWMIVTEQGDVEVSIANTPLYRVDLESIKHVR
jgi:hypothetical protein